jgi:hypothetical protein
MPAWEDPAVGRIIGIIAVVVILVIVIGGFLFYRAASDAEEESVDVALEEFRAENPATAAPAPGLPAMGVYDLAVTGEESISRGPISITRTLPERAPLIIRYQPQGYETESRYSDQHTEWVRYDLRADGAYADWAQTKVSAAAVSRTQPRDWHPQPLRLPVAPRVGQTWAGDYRSGDLRVRIESEVLRRDTVAVGQESVPVAVIRSTQTISGEYDGTRTEHFWYAPASALVARYQIESSLDGPVDLDFTADQTLTSLTPLT